VFCAISAALGDETGPAHTGTWNANPSDREALVEASGLVARFGLVDAALGVAIFGQAAQRTTPLRSGDRVELLRPLEADPKDARRRRAHDHPLPRSRPRPKRRRAA
jgi:putative ubiquitin-RnfH superfamily antitoxin RatB of RatAB toxin-antitoxin module